MRLVVTDVAVVAPGVSGKNLATNFEETVHYSTGDYATLCPDVSYLRARGYSRN